MYPELLRLGPITIHSFGFMVMMGFIVATLLMRKEFIRKDIDPELASNIGIAAIVGGFLGARIYFILEHWTQFLQDPFDMIFSGAGLVWYGGFIGGFGAVMWVILRAKRSPIEIGDIVMPLLLLGYAIGRLGCQLAGDGDYGPPSDVPWAMAYPRGVVPTEVPVHPTPIYDMILSGGFFFLIWSVRDKLQPRGRVFAAATIALGVERFITEFFRTTPKVAFGWMTLAQVISLILIAVAGYFFITLGRKAAAAEPVPTGKRQQKKQNRAASK